MGFTIFARATLKHYLGLSDRVARRISCGEFRGIAGFATRPDCERWLAEHRAEYKEFDEWLIEARPTYPE